MAAAAGKTINPEGKPVEDEEVVVGGTLGTIEESALNHQVIVAKRYPRSLTKFTQKLTEIAQMSQSVAMEMMYSVPRAGKQLVGPSVRFAEALISCWGNATATVEVIDTDKEWITSEGRFYDAETNVRIAVRVRRRITDKDNRRFNQDMIGVTGAAASSIALRGAILRGVPKALWADKFEMAKATAVGTAKSIDQLRGTMFATFAALGIPELRVLNALGVQGLPDVGPEQILALNAWHKQLKAGDSTVEDIFGSPDDDEIVKLMTELGWPAPKQKMSTESYKGRRNDHLNDLRVEVEKKRRVTGTQTKAPAATAESASEADTKTTEKTGSSETSAPETVARTEDKPKPAAKPTATEGW